jgi:hypothetical protein
MSKLKKSLVLNPFQRIAGEKALLWGVAGIGLTVLFCSITRIHFNGYIHLGLATENIHFLTLLLENLIIWLLPAILFYLTGLILSKSKIRLIDVLGTFAFAQLPLLVIPLFGFFPSFKYLMGVTTFDEQMLQNPDFITGTILSVLTLPFVVWNIIWLFQAYKTSCNLKGWKLGVSFAILYVALCVFICPIVLEQLFKFF